MTERHRSKHWSFGWLGWTALAVFLAILVPTLLGVDLRYQLLGLIQRGMSNDAMYRFVTGPLVWYGLDFTQPGISPFSLCYILILLYFWPRRVPAWAWAAVIFWAFFNPALAWSSIPRKLLGMTTFPYTPSASAQLLLVTAASRVVEVLVLARVTRSWVASVPLACATAAIVTSIGMIYFGGPFASPPMLDLVGYRGWHIAAVVPVGIWIWREHRKLRPGCPGCGYNLDGLTAMLCPECGASLQPSAPTTTTPASDTLRP